MGLATGTTQETMQRPGRRTVITDEIGRKIVCLVEEENTIILTEIRSHLLIRFEKNIPAT